MALPKSFSMTYYQSKKPKKKTQPPPQKKTKQKNYLRFNKQAINTNQSSSISVTLLY